MLALTSILTFRKLKIGKCHTDYREYRNSALFHSHGFPREKGSGAEMLLLLQPQACLQCQRRPLVSAVEIYSSHPPQSDFHHHLTVLGT